jgi:hypothetical protein
MSSWFYTRAIIAANVMMRHFPLWKVIAVQTAMAYDFESSATILVLVALIAVYLYILLSPNQPHLPSHPRNFVIPADTAESFSAFIKGKSEWKYTDDFNRMNYSSPDQPWRNAHDDFFLFEGGGEGTLSCFTWFIICMMQQMIVRLL